MKFDDIKSYVESKNSKITVIDSFTEHPYIDEMTGYYQVENTYFHVYNVNEEFIKQTLDKFIDDIKSDHLLVINVSDGFSGSLYKSIDSLFNIDIDVMLQKHLIDIIESYDLPKHWIVSIKGVPDEEMEISVVRNNNKHGQQSYGWFNSNKLCISQGVIIKTVFDKLVKVAYSVADELNEKEGFKIEADNDF